MTAPAHPFAWLRDHMTAAAWTAWIEPLTLGEVEGAPVIWCPSELVLHQAKDLAAAAIRRRFGAVAWAVRQ